MRHLLSAFFPLTLFGLASLAQAAENGSLRYIGRWADNGRSCTPKDTIVTITKDRMVGNEYDCKILAIKSEKNEMAWIVNARCKFEGLVEDQRYAFTLDTSDDGLTIDTPDNESLGRQFLNRCKAR